ncbi:MAG: zinc-binding dehydrogenase [Brachybacterium sp.]|nr:zinc-binding dehydrogenase [Brachybacterium sp.]
MKALVIHGAGDLRWEERPIPEAGPGEVLVRPRFIGICGSDLHYYFHGVNGEFVVREPLVPGHEMSAEVVEDPSGRIAPGTPVTVHPARFGPETPGRTIPRYLRPGGDYLGSAAPMPHRQGAACELLAVEADMIRELPAGLPLRRAALAEPLGVALHGVRVAGDISGARVLVVGAGPIGLLTIASALDAGAKEVVATDLHAAALERARALGATETMEVGTEDIPASSVDVVFECSGTAPGLTSALRAAAPAAVVVQVGILPAGPLSADLAPLVNKELQLRGTFRFDDEIDDAIRMLAADPRLDDVITHTVPASEEARGFDIARDAERSGKVLLELNPTDATDVTS